MEIIQNWKQTTANLYKAVQIFTWSGIAYSVFNFFADMGDVADTFSSIMSGQSSSFGFWDALVIIAAIAIIYGYWLFIKSLDIFKGQVNAADSSKVQSIRTSTLLMIIGTVLCVIPFLGLIGGIINLIAWIMLLMAYMNLKQSATFPQKAREGASKLFVAMLLNLIGWVIGLIPIIGGIVKLVLAVIAFFMVLKGWRMISESDEPALN